MRLLSAALAPFRHRPGLTATVVVTLALGLGATTAVYSLVDALLLRPLPYPAAEELVAVFETAPGDDRRGAAPANFLDWRRDARSFQQLAGSFASLRTIEAAAGAERVLGGSVSGSFFATLGVEAATGRTFRPREDSEGGPLRVVLGDALWRRMFAADPGMVGRTVRIDERAHEVVGIMPAGFAAPEPAEFWTLGDRGVPALGGFPGDLAAARDLHYFQVIGRLTPGVSLAEARAELESIARRLAAEYPATNTDLGVNPVPLRDAIIGDRAETSFLLLGVVGLVLLIAGANTANLLLTASAARAHEFSIRSALGATRGQLAGQLLLEGTGVALLAGALGLGGAALALELLGTSSPLAIPAATGAAIDARIFAFALGLSVLTGLGASLMPALRASRGEALAGLRGGRGLAGGSHAGLRRGLAVLQLGVSLTLLVGAGLLLRGYHALTQVDPGFRIDGIVTLDATLSRASYGEPVAARTYYDRGLEAIAAIPGVTGAAAISNLPTGGSGMNRGLRIEGRPDPARGTDQTIEYQVASPGYFATMGIPVLQGRGLAEADDASAPPVAVINEAARRRYWPDRDPIGTRVGFGRADGTTSWPTIVGVVADIRQFGLDQAPQPEVYVPMAQDPSRAMTVVVRAAALDQAGIAARAALQAIDPSQPVSAARPLTDQLASSVSRPRFLSRLLGVFAGIALGLAAIGLHGLLAQVVQGRTREIGVRLALGAAPRQMVWMILHDALRLVGMGTLIGLAGAAVLTRVLGGLLFGVSPLDPAVLGVTTAVLTGVALAAALLPARRAAGLDPAQVLARSEH